MELLVVRYEKKARYTLGNMYINGVYFCHTLEDTDRCLSDGMSLQDILSAKKVGETAIPTGRYRVELTMSPKFGRVLPILIGVKGFEGIRLHRGNSTADTSGCILVGDKISPGRSSCLLVQSGVAEARLVEALEKRQHGEQIYLTVV